ncbi:serine/threonine-protein kinase [Streptomyces sp. NPDC048172]|uniref:serine/threonine-protein kinase n=1 Tax=Streptomyces sp. NPDC048172 TaxID=3365505 RepID=UPI003710EF88
MKPLGTGDPLRLGPYRLIGVLGSGGMGKVYLGRDGAGGTAALKVLRTELAHDPNLAQRFVREAQTARAVRSEGVARVLDARTEAGGPHAGGQPWIATEFLAGPTLDDAVARFGPFDAAGVRALGAALARTLQDVHAAGLVHRDLKPPNIVLTSAGPRVIDFGIARPEHGLTLTTTGQAPVTPGYGPPEQVLGRRVGPAADVFAFGAVLAYAATGQRAFTGDHVAAVQYEVVHGEPRLEGLPPDLRAYVAPCLAKDPAERPTPEQIATALAPPRDAGLAWTAGPLAEDIAAREREAARLAALPANGTDPAADSSRPGRAGRPSRRRLLTGLVAGGAVLAAGGGTAAWLLGGDDTDGEGGDGDGDGRAAWDAKALSASSYEQGSAPDPLWGPVEAAGENSPAPLPVRDLVVVGGPDGTFHAYDVRSGKQRWKSPAAKATGGLVAPVKGRSGRNEAEVLFAATQDGQLLALNAEDGKRRWAAPARAAVLLAADATTVYLVTSDGRLRAVDTASRKTRWTVPAPVRQSAERPGRAAAGSGRLVVCGTDGRVAGVDARTGKTVWGPLRRAAGEKGAVALAPAVHGGTVYLGGRELAALTLSGGQRAWGHRADAATGWGAPVVSGNTVYAVDGAFLKARTRTDGAEKWTLGQNISGELPRAAAPVVQGRTVWCAKDSTKDASTQGVVAADTRGGQEAWPYSQGSGGSWHLAAAGNRVFVLHGKTLTAMPVI